MAFSHDFLIMKVLTIILHAGMTAAVQNKNCVYGCIETNGDRISVRPQHASCAVDDCDYFADQADHDCYRDFQAAGEFKSILMDKITWPDSRKADNMCVAYYHYVLDTRDENDYWDRQDAWHQVYYETHGGDQPYPPPSNNGALHILHAGMDIIRGVFTASNCVDGNWFGCARGIFGLIRNHYPNAVILSNVEVDNIRKMSEMLNWEESRQKALMSMANMSNLTMLV